MVSFTVLILSKITVFYCFTVLIYTLLLLYLITTHLVSHLSLSSVVFIISTLIISIFYCLNYTLLLLHLFITHLVIDFIITMKLPYVLRNYYDLYKVRAANKGWSTVNYCQSLVFDRLYLSCNDHCGWWLFQQMPFLFSEAAVHRCSSKQVLKMLQYSEKNFYVRVSFE